VGEKRRNRETSVRTRRKGVWRNEETRKTKEESGRIKRKRGVERR
jgi:hypothetical protein